MKTTDLEAKRLAVLQSLKKSALATKPAPIITAPTLRVDANSTASDSKQNNVHDISSRDLNETLHKVIPDASNLVPRPQTLPPPPPAPRTEAIPPPPKIPPRKKFTIKNVDVGRVYKGSMPKRSAIEQALIDLIRLGYCFQDIVEKTNVNPDILLKAFQQYGVSVIKPLPTPVPTVPSTLISSPALPANEYRNSKSPAVLTPTVLSNLNKPVLADRGSSTPSFGSDRWSKSLNITLTDDEADSESESEQELAPPLDTPRSTPALSASQTSSQASIKLTLEAQREKIRQVAAKLKFLQEQKTAKEGITAPTSPSSKPSSVTSDDTSSLPSKEDKTELLRQRLLAMKSRSENKPETPLTPSAAKDKSEILQGPANKEISHEFLPVPPSKADESEVSLAITTFKPDSQAPQTLTSTNPRVYNIAKSLERAREEQARIAHQRKILAARAEALDTNKKKKQIELLKRELEQKMNELVDQTYEFATVKASYEATKAQEERLQLGISSLEEQLTIEQNIPSPVNDQEPLMIPYNNEEKEPKVLEDTSDESKEQIPKVASAPAVVPASTTFATDDARNEIDSDVEIIDVQALSNDKQLKRDSRSKSESTLTITNGELPGASLLKRKRSISENNPQPAEDHAVAKLSNPLEISKSPTLPTEVIVPQPAQTFTVCISRYLNILTSQIKPNYYTKYSSPLKSFRSFRFSPFYKETVNGGYKSLTYSNTINQKRNIVCANEIFQGICKDKKCSNLHFTQMVPTGMNIISRQSFPLLFSCNICTLLTLNLQ